MHWHPPVLGVVETTCCCTRHTPDATYIEQNVLTNGAHDVRCHGWQTALYNLGMRLRPPCWFVDCDAAVERS